MAAIYEPQKASFLKRASAFLLDIILVAILATGFAFLVAWICKYDSHLANLNSIIDAYSAEYGINLSMTQAEYDALSQAEKELFELATKALVADSSYQGCMNMLFNLTILIISLSLLFSTLILEFVIPLIFKNGQTVGKKCFSLIVVKQNSVRMNNISLFIRTVLGKFTIELMVPALIIILIFFGFLGLVGTIVIIGLLVLQVCLLIFNRYHAPIHDLLALTVVVDKSTQLIFDDEESLIKYKEELGKDVAKHQSY